jgi:hypothetical protein
VRAVVALGGVVAVVKLVDLVPQGLEVVLHSQLECKHCTELGLGDLLDCVREEFWVSLELPSELDQQGCEGLLICYRGHDGDNGDYGYGLP